MRESYLQECLDALQKSQKILQEISTTCCLPQRSEAMQSCFQLFQQLQKLVEDKQEFLGHGLDLLTQCGRQIGELNVSCCTPTREKYYQELFQQLNYA